MRRNVPRALPCLTEPRSRLPSIRPSKTSGGRPGIVNRKRAAEPLAGTVSSAAYPAGSVTVTRPPVNATPSAVGAVRASVKVPTQAPAGRAASPTANAGAAAASVNTSAIVFTRIVLTGLYSLNKHGDSVAVGLEGGLAHVAEILAVRLQRLRLE